MGIISWLILCVAVAIAVIGCGNNKIPVTFDNETTGLIDTTVLTEYDSDIDEEDPDEDFSEESVSHAKTANLLIIGGGLQMLQVVWRLYKFVHTNKFNVTIVEIRPKLAPGLAYEDKMTPEMLMHAATADDTWSEVDDFLAEPLKPIHETGDTKYDRVKPPPPRDAYGRHVAAKFDTYLRKGRANNYEFDLFPNTEAIKIKKGKEYGFLVQLSNHQLIHATDVILATGHWFRSRFNKTVDGYFECPWPAKQLKRKIKEPTRIAIYGTGLSAIDTVMSLAHKFGEFYWNADNVLSYRIKPKYAAAAENFNMTMYSRTGYLPPVAGEPMKNPSPRMSRRSREIEHYGYSNGFLPLEDILNLMKGDIEDNLPRVAEHENFNRMSAQELMKHIDSVMYSGASPKDRLVADIAAAQKSVNGGPKLILGPLFLRFHEAFNTFLQHFSAEDTLEFQKYIAPAILKYHAPTHPYNAERLLALMEANCLELVGVGADSVVVPDEKRGVWVHYKGTKVYHKYLIDAMGQNGYVKMDERPLTKSLFKNKLIQQLYIPYSSDTKGRLDRAKQRAEGRKNDLVKRIRGKIHHKTYGVEINMKTMHVIPPGETYDSVKEKASNGVIYATGPFAYGRRQFAHNIHSLEDFATFLMEDLSGRRFPTAKQDWRFEIS